ncbi:MAG: carbohydrate ABC transporter permease [Enterocloster sp.]
MTRRNKHIGIIALFVLPALFFYGTFNVVGIVRTFFYSFMDWKGISANRTFIGLGNYIELFGDSFFWNAMKNNVILVIVSVAIQLPGALLLALLINQELKGTRFFRTVFFMPMLLSTVATGIMWILFYDPYFGLMANLMQKLGMKSIAFLEEVPLCLPLCSSYAGSSSLYMIILKAGLTNISADIYEAAKIDGANGNQCFWRITLPLLMAHAALSRGAASW